MTTAKPQPTRAVAAPHERRKALASVKSGVLDTPVRVLIYGTEGVGKSTFAAGAPFPIFLGAENGTERLNVERLQPSHWQEAIDWLDDLARDTHHYKTLVLDPLNWLEPLCWAYTVRDCGGTIDEFGGGYQKGYTAALDHWRVLLAGVERCWQRGMHVVLSAHSRVKNFANPQGTAYDRYELALWPNAAGVFKQWCDAVLYAELETFTRIEKGSKRATGYTSGARVMHTQPSAAYDAKSRWKMPETLPLSWDDFWGAMRAETERAAELVEAAKKLAADLGDPKVIEFTKEYVAKHLANSDRLAELVNRLNLKIEETKKETA